MDETLSDEKRKEVDNQVKNFMNDEKMIEFL